GSLPGPRAQGNHRPAGADVRGRTLPSTSLCFFEVVDEGFGRVVQVDYRTTVPGTGRGAVAEVGWFQPDVGLLVAGEGDGDQRDIPAVAVSDVGGSTCGEHGGQVAGREHGWGGCAWVGPRAWEREGRPD